MRLGILLFDTTENSGQAAEQAADALCAVLRSRDVDVVINAPEPDALTTPERPAPVPAGETATASVQIAAFAHAQEAGGRLGRADCDGVLFWLGTNANPAFAPPAALSLACPILLCGALGNAAFYNMAGVLADRGVPFDRLALPEGDGVQAADFVQVWLQRNSKKERQKGTEAAQKLFGKRLIIPNEAAQTVDAAQWFHQFGILVTGAPDESGENDFVAENGDAFAALTLFLLRGICETDANIRAIRAGDAVAVNSNGDGELSTLVQIYRRKGRFTCLLTLASVTQADGFSNALFGSVLHVAPGDVRSRMKAACFALDIDVVEWETGEAFSDAPV